MDILKILILFFGLYFPCHGTENTSLKSHSKYGNEECRDTTTTHSYGYTKFYHITRSETSNKNHEFVLKFMVLAKSDAHILLTPAPAPEPLDPVYEIVLGAGRNSFSDIRRSQRAGSKSTTGTVGLLSQNETRAFWIRLAKDGMLAVGRWGEDMPFLFWQDPDPLPVRYFSFSTWNNIWGTWRYNCVENNNTSEVTEEEVARPMSMHEKLRRDLLNGYDPYAHPNMMANQRTTVFMHLKCHQINIDDKRAVLLVDGFLKMQWTDEKLIWNHDDYENLKQLHIEHHEIWQPEIFLYNAASGHGANILGEAALTVDFDGIVTWMPATQLDAWCDVDLTNWPNDQQVCLIQLGVWSQDQLIELSLLTNEDPLSDKRTGSEWKLLELLSETTWTKTPWKDLEPESGLNIPFSAITLQFTLERRSHAIHVILVTPLFLFAILSIIPFWMCPFAPAKLSVLGLNMVLLSMFLLAIGMVLPASAVADHLPNIVLAYVLAMLSVIFSIIISILGICLVRYNPTNAPPAIIQRLLTARPTRKILLLPEIHQSKIGLLQEEAAAKHMTAEDMARHWFILVKAMDRAMCLINTIFWATILAKQNL